MTPDDLLAWQGVIVAVCVMTIIGVIVVMLGRVLEARAAARNDDAYRQLAEAAAAAQQEHATEVARLGADIDDLKRSLTAVEQLLREVG